MGLETKTQKSLHSTTASSLHSTAACTFDSLGKQPPDCGLCDSEIQDLPAPVFHHRLALIRTEWGRDLGPCRGVMRTWAHTCIHMCAACCIRKYTWWHERLNAFLHVRIHTDLCACTHMCCYTGGRLPGSLPPAQGPADKWPVQAKPASRQKGVQSNSLAILGRTPAVQGSTYGSYIPLIRFLSANPRLHTM